MMLAELRDTTGVQLLSEREIPPDFRFSLAKELRGNPRKRAFEAILRRDGTKCTLKLICNGDLDAQTVEHVNGDKTDHRYCNLKGACVSCNSAAGTMRKPSLAPPTEQGVSKREREGTAGWNATEGKRASIMRPLWNNWVREVATVRYPKDKLAKKAVHSIGLGSSITYDRYLKEDIEGEVLVEWQDEETAMWFVKYVPKDTKLLLNQKDSENPK